MKTKVKLPGLVVAIIFGILTNSCSKDGGIEPIAIDPCVENPCGSPDQCDDDNGGQSVEGITRDDITPEGNVVNTGDGYTVEGKVTMETESGEAVVFEEADLDVEFNEDGSLKNFSGTVEIPTPSNYFEFEDPIQADVGFFTGKFLNDNRDFEIRLKDERKYFVFAIAVAIEMTVGANDDPDATKPITVSPPLSGGHITLIADYDDPMFFYSIGINGGLGDGNGNGDGNNNGGDGNNGDGDDDGEVSGVSFGSSLNAYLRYEPTLPVENVVAFDAKTVTGGTFSFWTVLEASGMYYKNSGFDVDFNLKEPMNSDIGVGYRAGINGSMSFSADIKNIVSFGFPIGQGSAAIVAEASTNNGINARAFVNGLVDPDLSWWPEFIPISPDGQLNVYGYVEQTGAFDMGLSGNLGLETPTGPKSVDGALRLTQDAFTMDGKVTIDDEIWEANITMSKEQTKAIATPPSNFTDGISETVTAQIDEAIETTEQAIADLEAANEQYELELSLRGLRAALPGIIDRANDEIDDAVAAGVASGRSQANKILNDNNRVLCSDNISSVVNSMVKPYRDALNRLKNAVNNSNDNTQTRNELEAALRQLAGLDRINKSATVTINHGHKTFGCGNLWRLSNTRTVTINETILTATQKAQLLEAADNVQYIEEAEGIKFDAQVIVDQLPTTEELENLKDGVEACISELTDGLEKSGFIYVHETKEFRPFIVINGEEIEVGGFDVFSTDELIAKARVETDNCNPDQALKELQTKVKK
ncbi:hypothetical protein [Flagellimonas onchidii]|uniref:hypothetical protein n=1 Tax=Flagellimonas onchidii TaxID=2562684 RepID=UPI0010A65083|nr:hypothetical protein [Allomuricauda onchidii]